MSIYKITLIFIKLFLLNVVESLNLYKRILTKMSLSESDIVVNMLCMCALYFERFSKLFLYKILWNFLNCHKPNGKVLI